MDLTTVFYSNDPYILNQGKEYFISEFEQVKDFDDTHFSSFFVPNDET